VVSVERDEMEAALGGLAGRHRFVPDYGHLTVFGTCEDCAGRPD
jgi:Fur family ferric uptake transcriptional regulator